MGILVSNFGSFTLAPIMIFLSNVILAHAVGEISTRSFTYTLITTANNIDHTSISRTYDKTRSVLHCAKRCSNTMAPSFYFVGQTSTCYCSNHHNPDIQEYYGQGSIRYGLLVSGEPHSQGPRQGNSSECQDVYDSGARDAGVYNESTGEQIFCNLTALSWVVFQRRLDGSLNFERNWTEYVGGFGDKNGEFWLGLEAIHQSTQNGCELQVYLEAEPSNSAQYKGFARYSNFSVSAATDNYRLHVSGYSGNVGDSLAPHNGYMFSTYDVDNDVWADGFCAELYYGAWWFRSCLASNLNGANLVGSHASPLYGDGILWGTWMGYEYSLLRTEMAFRC